MNEYLKVVCFCQMTFHGGYKETILFETWETKTVGGEYLFVFPLRL